LRFFGGTASNFAHSESAGTGSHDCSAFEEVGVVSFRRDAGLKLAKSGECKARDRVVRVPSRSKPGAIHLVNLKNDLRSRCGCKDNVVNSQICAHIWAARFLLEWEPPPGEPLLSNTKPARASIPSDWGAYNVAEVNAPRFAREMLTYLAQNLIELSHHSEGQP
jgi:hypothetical protein